MHILCNGKESDRCERRKSMHVLYRQTGYRDKKNGEKGLCVGKKEKKKTLHNAEHSIDQNSDSAAGTNAVSVTRPACYSQSTLRKRSAPLLEGVILRSRGDSGWPRLGGVLDISVLTGCF